MIIKIDKDMLLVELYELRSLVTDTSVQTEETMQARKKLDEIVNLISLAPSAENNQSFPKISIRGSKR
jgi:hypothetical protein